MFRRVFSGQSDLGLRKSALNEYGISVKDFDHNAEEIFFRGASQPGLQNDSTRKDQGCQNENEQSLFHFRLNLSKTRLSDPYLYIFRQTT